MASSSNPKLNRLASSKSPYLLQHATNPVDWYEWTPEAFALAQEHDKPIFLSVGYSACHWCHVLAHENFEDNDVAAIMNEHFVNIKVDREERPDVDSLYMTFLQATSGGGGWPMSVFLTPSLKPFFAGTYFPRPKFISLLGQISTLWKTKREDVISSADDILEQLRSVSTSSKQIGDFDANKVASTAASKIFAHLYTNFDNRHGGFSIHGPKFPSPAQSLDFLVAYAARPIQPPTQSGDPDGELEPRGYAAYMAVRTLRCIWEGGIRDHVGGGVARYSVDERWHVPHFEKMLYDQGQLARTALLLSLLPDELLLAVPPAFSSLAHVPEAPRKMLRDLACNILTYAERDLLDKAPGRGAFWSAEDADSKERFDSTAESPTREAVGPSLEGAFYVWTAQEIEEVLKDSPDVNGIAPVLLFKERYGVKASGNVDAKNDIQGELTGKNVLYEAVPLRSLAEKHQLDEGIVRRSLEQSLARLYSWRNEHRPRPHLDDKVVLAWNGLMISAYALAHCSLPADGSYPMQSRAISIAENIVSFIEENMLDPNTMHLNRTWRNGYSGPRAQADDHAFFIRGLLDLYEASRKEKYLILAIKLQQRQNDLFGDDEGGGYFTSVKDDHILLRSKDAQDGAEPSAVSITLSNLARLSHFDTAQTENYNEKILRTFKSIAPLLEGAPRTLATSVIALMQQVAGYRQFIVQGSSTSAQVQAYLEILHQHAFIPNRVLVHLDPEWPPHELAARNVVVKSLVDDIQERKRQGKKIEENVRLCEGFTCQLPVADPTSIKRLVTQTF